MEQQFKCCGLIMVARAVRCFFVGMFNLVVFEQLMNRGLTLPQIAQVQMLAIVGQAVISRLLVSRVQAIGAVNCLMIASVLKGAAGLVLTHTSSLNLLSTASLLGVVAFSGEWFCPFANIQKMILAQTFHPKEQSQPSNSSKRGNIMEAYHLIGIAFEGLGIYTLGHSSLFIYYNYPHDSISVIYGPIFYTFSAFVGIVIYAFLDRKTIQANQEIIVSRETSSNFLLPLLYCLEGAATGLISPAYLGYFFRFTYEQQYVLMSTILSQMNLGKIILHFFFKLFWKNYGTIAFILTAILPGILLLLVYQAQYSLDFAYNIIISSICVGSTYQRRREGVLESIFEGRGKACWPLIVGGYSFGAVIGMLILQTYYLDFYAPLIISGVLRLLFDIVTVLSFSLNKERLKVQSFADLLTEQALVPTASWKAVTYNAI